MPQVADEERFEESPQEGGRPGSTRGTVGGVRIVVALGGNALLRRGERPDAALQQEHVEAAVASLAPLLEDHEVVLTHGNGPQVGVLAAQSAADHTLTRPYPLDVLGAQTQGMIGYWLVQAVQHACPLRPVVALVNRTLVDSKDPGLTHPTKPVGRVLTEDEGRQAAARHGWQIEPEGGGWRRVVGSPEPRAVIEQDSIRGLLETGTVVVCGGGGGVPVVADREGRLHGVEAVVDKDLTAALLADAIGADALLVLTDVAGVIDGFGSPDATVRQTITAAEAHDLDLPAGSMGPKVDAALRFAAKGGLAVIGRAEDATHLLTGCAGTRALAESRAEGPGLCPPDHDIRETPGTKGATMSDTGAATTPSRTDDELSLAEQWVAPNYHPLDVVIHEGHGPWVTDVEGRRYLDALAGYSALNFGHGHPDLVAAAHQQLDTLTLISRAFHSDALAPFCRDLATLAGKELVLPMNTGAEAVETAIKTARRWGYLAKGVPAERARIIVMDGNFHGRTTTIVSFSTDPVAREYHGPFTPGFDIVPYGDLDAIRAAITDETVAVLLEPIQGEGGVLIPPDEFLRGVRELTREQGVLMLADEVQSGLGRTGYTFACDHEEVVPDLYILGKALGGGIVPVSAVVADRAVLGVYSPGTHGSTFGGNPLAAAVGHAVVRLLATGEYQASARRLGARLAEGLEALVGHGLVAVRCRGLWAGLDIDPALMTGREASLRLLDRGVLAKDTHGSTIRLAPPLVVDEDEVDFLVDTLAAVLRG